jgi:hypothetical protein
MKNAILFILEQLEDLKPQHRAQIEKLRKEVAAETPTPAAKATPAAK